MSWRTNPFVLATRNLGRSLGLNRVLGSLLRGRGYEDRFQKAMFATVRKGDVVWDVGANVGLYSARFSDCVGGRGAVFAFEPSPANLLRLREAAASLPNVTVVPLALGDREDVVCFEQGDDPLGATSRVVDKPRNPGGHVEVRLSTGDRLVADGVVAPPAVVKIDTEGFELDVLLGLRQALRSRNLRALCIEVHFGLLQARGLANAPSEIERLLVSSGFSPHWVDASHIVASRTD